MNPVLRPRRRSLLIKRRLAIALLTFLIAIAWSPLALGQIPFFSSPSETQTQVTPWWDISKARRCGKLLCSEVTFPYFPLGKIFENFTLAIEPKLEQDLAQVTSDIEERAATVEETMVGIFRQTVKARREKESKLFNTSQEKLNWNWKYWLVTTDKGRHPLTPKVEIGTKNQLTVIYVPAQPDLGLYQQTIVTVNQADALYNGKPIPELAQQWQDLISICFNEALWGVEFNLRYPWARIILIAAILLVILVPIAALSLVRKFLRALDRNFRKELRLLEQSAKSEKIAAATSNLPKGASELTETESSEPSQKNLDEVNSSPQLSPLSNHGSSFNEKTTIRDPASANSLVDPDPQLASIVSPRKDAKRQTNLIKQVSNLLGIFGKTQKSLSAKVQILLQNLPKVSLQRQNWLKQLHNVTRLSLDILLWTRIFIFLFGIALMFAIYPSTRKLCIFFLGQAIVLPIIWMLVSFADTLVSFLIDYYLNQWAQEAQVDDPTSTRYALRVSTYSPAIKGASTFLFILFGIYLTFRFLEINPAVLASAGGVALVLGFLSRNILEDMLNGALILWTDRYAIGDVIKVGELAGFVENMNLYTTQLRGAEGRLITIPNGQISTVENLTKDWSRVDFAIEIAYNADTQKAIAIIEQVAEQMRSEPEWQDTILEPATILGVDQIAHTGITIKVWLKTQPIKQWSVGREFRLRIKQAFDDAGIAPGVPQQIWRGDRTIPE
ncbi:MAG: mechanosensitive ion channel family protein [Xenococcus sp. MO_188.B8]|nr:mechanosensitive ion channel family protein [Xenococcus sp. MO_188.B8]